MLVGPMVGLPAVGHERSASPQLNIVEDAAMLSSLEVEVITEEEIEVLSAATLYHRGDPDVTQGGGLAKAVDDSLAHAYGDTLNFFEGLLEERREDNPLDGCVQAKLVTLRQLQSELERVISDGLMSPKRQRWLAEKADLVARQMECKEDWYRLRMRQERAVQAWAQLADQGSPSEEEAPAKASMSSAIVVAEELTLSQVLSKTSLREQVDLVREHAALSERQMRLDVEDERLMVEALQLYQDEQKDRERRERIVKQQQAVLVELERLIGQKSAFVGHSTFGGSGFVEGMLY